MDVSWSIKKDECWRIDAFELWCWSRLLRVPWMARRSNQSILKEISPEYSLEGLMLKLKLQYFDYLMQRTELLEKTLMLGKIEGGGPWGGKELYTTERLTELNWMSLSHYKKNEIMPFSATWMDLETITLNEVSQRKIIYMWNLKKENELIYKTNKLRDFKNKLMVTRGEMWREG